MSDKLQFVAGSGNRLNDKPRDKLKFAGLVAPMSDKLQFVAGSGNRLNHNPATN